MNSHTVYSSKAEKYDRYRWDYAPAAIAALFDLAQVSQTSVLADLGAGTGILTRHLARQARQVFAVEPNSELRQILAKNMAPFSNVTLKDGSAECTGLDDHSLDLITVAQAIHWFDPEPARREMKRILKPGGRLVLLRNYPTGADQNAALGSLMRPEYGVNLALEDTRPPQKPLDFYFGGEFRHQTFPFQFTQTWDEFLGALTTASYMPDEDHPLFARFEARAREIFAQFSQAGQWLGSGETELIVGEV